MRKLKLKGKDFTYYGFQVLRKPVKWFLKSKLNINLVVNEAQDDKGPFFITGNHVTAFDPIISLVYVKPLVKFVAADANLDNWIKKFFFKLARVIPIRKRSSDISTIRRLLDEVKAGNAVGLYPEGGRTWHGETDELISSTAKLIKMLGIRVYSQKLKGAYMSSPRWGKHIYKGRVDVYIEKILTEEDIERMSTNEILDVLKQELYHNDYEYQREVMTPLKGIDRAEYIERLIFVCPKCERIHTFMSQIDEFKCKACGKKGRVNQYGFIEGEFPFDNLVDWHHYQMDFLHKYLETNCLDPISLYDVRIKQVDEFGNKKKRLGNMIIEQDKVKIEYPDEIIELDFSKISEPSITFKNTLIFYVEKTRYEMVIEPFLHNNASIVYIREVIDLMRRKK
ncbi:MAG: hypothetical protein GX490_09500 [Bacilli bacterium]|nr:hypothetical protein [Bacilli bacterium]